MSYNKLDATGASSSSLMTDEWWAGWNVDLCEIEREILLNKFLFENVTVHLPSEPASGVNVDPCPW